MKFSLWSRYVKKMGGGGGNRGVAKKHVSVGKNRLKLKQARVVEGGGGDEAATCLGGRHRNWVYGPEFVV